MTSAPKPTPSRAQIAAVLITAAVCGLGGILTLVNGDSETPKPTAPAAVETASPAPTPVPTVMPNIAGQNAAVAENILKRAGFTNITFGSVDPDETVVILAANWTVTEQSTPAGDTIPSDMLIVLGCTKRR